MADVSSDWEGLICKIGDPQANRELDRRINEIFATLRDITSICTSQVALTSKVKALKATWSPARDQYKRSVLHLAALNGNTRLVCALIKSGAQVNVRDGIGQTPLTLSLHMNHFNTAKVLVDAGSSVRPTLFEETISPLEIASVKNNAQITDLIQNKILLESSVIDEVSRHFSKITALDDESMDTSSTNYSRCVNITVGDQKNTATVLTCANRCPDIYGCHSPGGGDFHNRGYLNESIARIAGPGGFWYVTEQVMKRPTVNPESFKKKFQDNNYNNNEEALLDFDDGVSIAMIKEFHESSFFPTQSELNTCIENTGSHNKILLKKFKSWISDGKKDNVLFSYHSQTINELMPITRWYKESIRHGNGMAIEGVWMLCPPLYCQVGKTNYRDEAFVQIVNAIAKWPRAYKLMYRQNRTVNVSGKQGHQLAGDEWVEDFLVRPVKQFISAQSSFSMVELMSCSANILELNKEMYKSSAAFDVHQTKKHQKPSSLYDQTKVAQFALKEEWFKKTSSIAKKYPWGGKSVKPQEPIPKKCLNVFKQGDEKARKEFKGFLNRKFPNDMI